MAHENTLLHVDMTVPGAITPGVMNLWYRNLATRRILACLPVRGLQDAGIPEIRRAREIAKPFRCP